MAKNLKMLDKIIDDLALGRYETQEKAIADLIAYGEDPLVARTSVLAMETIDVINNFPVDGRFPRNGS